MSGRSLALLSVAAVCALVGCGDSGGGDTATLSETDLVQPTEPSPQPSHPAATTAKAKFAETCGSCHTLKAAGTNGMVGPNLDKAKPSRALVARFIRNGSSDGVMPAGLFQGRDAAAVAAYVARVAGR